MITQTPKPSDIPFNGDIPLLNKKIESPILNIFLIPVTIERFNGPHLPKNTYIKICPIDSEIVKSTKLIRKAELVK